MCVVERLLEVWQGPVVAPSHDYRLRNFTLEARLSTRCGEHRNMNIALDHDIATLMNLIVVPLRGRRLGASHDGWSRCESI